ncbi:MAG: hypothetical protein KDM63_03995 [Verrucomicrobiae bacterium]|nr:hypothetical protein [Verrucomicrobiae bacterium]
MTKPFGLPVALTLVLFLIAFAASALEVKSTNGQAMDVEVLGYTKSSGNLRIKRLSDGMIFNTKIELFDDASRAAIEKAAPVMMPDLKVEVSVGKRRARIGDSSYMKKQEITTTLKISNGSRDIDLGRSKFTVLLMGRSTSRFANRDADAGKVLAKESFEQSIPAGKMVEFESKPVMTEFDSDFDASNIGGWEYDGYVLIIQDSEGKIVDSKSNIGPVQTETLKDPEKVKKALELQKDTIVDRALNRLNRSF